MSKDDTMLRRRSPLARPATYSLLLIALFAQECLEVHSETRFEPGGSGTWDMDVRVKEQMLRSLQAFGQPSGGDVAKLGAYMSDSIRARTDTIPGVRVDSLYQGEDGEMTHHYVRVSFDSVGALAHVLKRTAPENRDEFRIREEDGVVSINHGKIGGENTSQSESEAGRLGEQFGRSMVLGMFDIELRYIFPAGTTIQDAAPEASVSDTTVVYQITTADLMGTESGGDSLYVRAQIPKPALPELPLPVWAIALSVALLVAGGLVLIFREG